MAAQSDTGNLTYFLNGEPVVGQYRLDTGKLTHFINGEPMATISPIIQNFGNFFLIC